MDSIFDDRMSRILDNLYLGNVNDSLDRDQMTYGETFQIRAVVRIDDHPEEIEQIAVNPAPRYHMVEMIDSHEQVLKPFFSDVNDFVHQARLSGETVLIHCQAGISRSASLTVIYLMSVTDFGFDDVWRCVRLARWIIKPKWGFMAQLSRFDKFCLNEERKQLKDKFGLSERFHQLATSDNAALEKMVRIALLKENGK